MNIFVKSVSFLFVLVFLTILLPFQSRASAQNSPIDTRLASQYFREAQTLCDRDSNKLWGVSLGKVFHSSIVIILDN